MSKTPPAIMDSPSENLTSHFSIAIYRNTFIIAAKQNLPALKKQGDYISYFRSQPSDELPASMEIAA